MLSRKVFEIQAETYLEEQYIMSKLPEAVWIPSVRGAFATFYVPESKAKIVEKVLNEWKVKQNGR
jgi:hypothetical protein